MTLPPFCHNPDTHELQIDWANVANLVGYKNAAVASVRFGTIKKRWGLTAGSAGGSGIGNSATNARKRVARGNAPAGARKRVDKAVVGAKKGGVNAGGAKRGAKAKAKFVEEVKNEDESEVEEQEETRDLVAGSDDEEDAEKEEEVAMSNFERGTSRAATKEKFQSMFSRGRAPRRPTSVEEESFESKVNRDFYAESAADEERYDENDDAVSDGRGGQLQEELTEHELQAQMQQQMGQQYQQYEEEEYVAYDPDAVFEDAVEEQEVLPGITVHREVYARPERD